jgi:class 3 adenylate cyclase
VIATGRHPIGFEGSHGRLEDGTGAPRPGCQTVRLMSEAIETHYAPTLDGACIAYQVLGDGPLDLLEPAGGSYVSIDMRDDEPRWWHFERRLASFSRLIRFDPRGVGLSDPLSRAAPLSIEDLVSDAEAVLDAAGSERAAVLGQGRGGLVSILLSATKPERVQALVLGHAFARLTWAPDYPEGVPAQVLDDFVNGVLRVDGRTEPIDDVALLLPSLANDDGFRRWWQRAGRAGASPAVARAHYEIGMNSDLRPVLDAITVPTLVVHRAGNRYYPVSLGRYLGEHIAGARYVEFDGADSFLWAGNADEVLDEIEEFLTGAVGRDEPDRVLATVMFTDIVGSTARAVEMGDRDWRGLLDTHDRLVRRQLERSRGREIKTTGDGFLATFDGPARAIRCALAIRDAAQQIGIEVRAGLHTGEIEQRGDDVAGIAVHLAQRVSAVARPSEVLVSRTVTDLVAGSGINFEDRGEHELKGVPGNWKLYAVVG